jgi:cob(I)alamin adenosyltransferase
MRGRFSPFETGFYPHLFVDKTGGRVYNNIKDLFRQGRKMEKEKKIPEEVDEKTVERAEQIIDTYKTALVELA